MANFPKTPPAIGRSTGLRGQNGATGPAGAGTVPGVIAVDSLSGTPRTVTDWGTIINASVASGKRRFAFGPYDYLYSTPIDLRQIQGVIFEGAGGLDWYDPGRTDGPGKETGHTRLIFTAASGITEADGVHTCAIASSSTSTGVNGNTGFSAQDMMFLYNNGSFAGDLIDECNGGFGAFDRCYFGSATGSVNSARCALKLGNVNMFNATNCMFGPNFTSAARGWEATADGGYTEHVRFTHCVFSCPALVNPGSDFLYDQCNFEFPVLTPGQVHISSAAITKSFGVQLMIRDCEMWDSATGTYFIRQPSGVSWDLSITGLVDHTDGGMAKCLDLQGNGSVILIGSQLTDICDFGDGTISTSQKDRIVAIGNNPGFGWGGVTTQVFVNIDKGHQHVVNLANTEFNAGASNFSVSNNGLISLTHEKVDRTTAAFYQPTAAVHAGATNVSSVAVFGSDLAGYIIINTGSGGASNTGDIVDFTFTHPVTSNVVTGGNHLPCPSIVLSPTHLGTNGIGTNSIAAAWACQPYVDILNCDLNTGFSIGVVNAIPASTTIALAYRVIQL